MKIKVVSLIIAALILLSASLGAHHSFVATYDVQKEFTIKGKIVEITLRSPHSFFFVEAQDDNGSLQKWAIESANPAKINVKFNVGDLVEVKANPARVGKGRGRMVMITRTTDGVSWGGEPGQKVD
jgi:lysyl-tRNA synthetase class II